MIPANNDTITQSTQLTKGTYFLPNGITIQGDGVTLDGNGATLIGADQSGVGIRIVGAGGVTIRNVRLLNYQHNIHATDCVDLTIDGCVARDSAEIPPNTTFLNIFSSASDLTGSGILFERVTHSQIINCDVQHQQNGIALYGCKNLTVDSSIANYASGFGIYLCETTDSTFSENYADYCCRYQPRGEGGHLGADAAGFVIVKNSSRNKFLRNKARLGGDGFFLAGLTHSGQHAPCNDNLFEENDGSHSPNIAFEGTFSSGNIYRNNKASSCNYGFWLGFSSNCVIEGNDIHHNRRAGIAVENGVGMTVEGNQFYFNEFGILLWSKYVERFAQAVPNNNTSRDWTITNNKIARNFVGIRIAADQDHGTHNLPEGTQPTPPPRRHAIHQNKLWANQKDLDVSAEAVD